MKGLEVGDAVLILYGRKVLSAIFIDTGDEQSKLCVVGINSKVESVERDHVFSDDEKGKRRLYNAIIALRRSLDEQNCLLAEEERRLLGELRK